MWWVKFMEEARIKGYHFLLTVAKKILADDEDKIQEREIAELKLLNLTAYNEIIIIQEDIIYFHIIEEAKT